MFFKKLSAAEASESVYMRERVNTFHKFEINVQPLPKCSELYLIIILKFRDFP